MANNLGIPPSGKQHSQVIINSNLTAEQAVDDHFAKSIGGGAEHWQRRNLPEGFFSKPSTTAKSSANTSVAHSRDGSTDSSGRFTMSPPATAFASSGMNSVAAAVGSAAVAGSIQHSRTQSSPATLSAHMSLAPPPLPPHGGAPFIAHTGRTLSAAPTPAQTVASSRAHQKQHRSVDNTLDDDKTSSLPYGWQMKFTETGQPYYINSIDKTTTWEDPRKTLSASNLSLQQQQQQQHLSNPNIATNAQPPAASSNLGPLPAGWEEAFTATGDKYFINHNVKSTSWYDPRLPEEVQKPIIVQRLMNQHQQQRGQPGSSRFPGGHHGGQGQLPPHAGASSFSPMIQQLHQERQRMNERNLEIREQGLLDRLSPGHPLSPGHNMGHDAFLGVAGPPHFGVAGASSGQYPSSSSAYDFHSRQESSDSGLGMPIGYPHTPENYLGTSDIDLSFSGINLMDSSLQMDVDPSNIPATLDNLGIAPNELDQYLNHH